MSVEEIDRRNSKIVLEDMKASDKLARQKMDVRFEKGRARMESMEQSHLRLVEAVEKLSSRE